MTKRIALVSPYALSVFGGVQEQVLAMSRVLSARGHDVLVVAPDSKDDAVLDTPAQVHRVGRLLSLPANGSRAPLTLSFNASRRAHALIRDFAPDVVHFHEPFAPLVGWATLRAHDVASVATFHRSGSGPALTLTKPLLRSLAKGVDVAASVSSAAHDTIHESVGIETTVLFNGFETERFRRDARVTPSDVVLVCVARLEERKGVNVAIRAVREHNASNVAAWRLVIIGDGPQRARLEGLAAHDDAIRFEGALDDASKRSWLRRASAVLAPSLRGESFGLVLLEAMASEVPVVASDISGYREAASGHASLFAPGDSLAMGRAIESALIMDANAIEGARQHAEQWSMTRLVERYELLYDQARDQFTSGVTFKGGN
jgi:phosphatidylinositol alpha-mannosyltransferase